MKPFNQITFTLSASSGLWRCTMKMDIHDVVLAEDMTPDFFEDQKRRFESRGFPVKVVELKAPVFACTNN